MEENKQVFMSDEIKDLSAALTDFQSKIEQPKLEKEVVVKTKTGSSYKFKYADLSACVRAATPALKEAGLAVSQIICDGKLVTLLSHKSGQWIKSEMFMPQVTSDYQAYGSAITYLKRYSYCAILGIVADTDDDANMACENEAQIRERSNNSAIGSIAYTGEQLRQALEEINAVDYPEGIQKVWSKWVKLAPAICKNGTEFYNAVCAKNTELNKSKQ